MQYFALLLVSYVKLPVIVTMSQPKNVMNTSQVDVAFLSTDLRRDFSSPTAEEVLEPIRPSTPEPGDFQLVDNSSRKVKRRPDYDRLARRERKLTRDKRRVSPFMPPREQSSQLASATQPRSKVARDPVTWHLPYVKPFVVDHSKRMETNPHVGYPPEGAPWEFLSVDEQQHLLTASNLPASEPGFASDTWGRVSSSSRAKPRPRREPKVEVRHGFVTLYRNHVIPTKHLSVEKVDHLTSVVNAFLRVKQKMSSARPMRLDIAIRAIDYRRTGADRLYMNSAMATLVHTNIASLKSNIGKPAFVSLCREANVGVVNSKFGLPGPSHGTQEADVLYQARSDFERSVDDVFDELKQLRLARRAARAESASRHDDDLFQVISKNFIMPYYQLCTDDADLDFSVDVDEFEVSPVESWIEEGESLSDPVLGVHSEEFPEYQMAAPTLKKSRAVDLLEMIREDCPSIARIVSLLYVLRSTKGRYDVWLAAFVAYLSAEEMVVLIDYVKFFLLEVFPSGITYESGTSVIDEMLLSPIEKFEKSAIYRAAWNLFGSFSIHGVLKSLGVVTDSSLIGSFFKWCTPLLKREPGGLDSMDSFLSRIVKFAKLCVSTILVCVQEKSFLPIFSADLTFHEWMDWTNFLLFDTSVLFEPGNPAGTADFEKKLAAGEVPHRILSQMTKQDIMVQLADAIREGQSLEKRHEKDSVLLSAIQRHLSYVKTERIALSLDTPHGAFRIQPFGILLCGPAGCGKSRLCHDMHMACARKSGHRADASGVLRIDASANFADGAMRGQSTVLFDDIDSKPAPPSAGHDDHVSIVNKYINVTPFNIEQASIEKKGKVWAGFTLALYTTNFEDCRLRDYCPYPAMFWRRFPIRVYPRVKPEYANAAGGIDKSKIPDVGHVELHDFIVQTFQPSKLNCGNDYIPPYEESDVYHSKVEFFAAITSLYSVHYEAEKKIAKRVNDDDTETVFCPSCCLMLRDHKDGKSCGLETQMKAVEVEPPKLKKTDELAAVLVIFGYGALFYNMFTKRVPTYRGRDNQVHQDWFLWLGYCWPMRSDFTYIFGLVWPLLICSWIGWITVYTQIWCAFFGNFLLPEVDGLIVYAVRSYLPQLEKFLWGVIYTPFIGLYQAILPSRLFSRLMRAYERSQAYLEISRHFVAANLERIKQLLAALTMAGGAVYLWRLYSADEVATLQSALYKDYRRPPGVPVGDTPYKRVMQDELLTRAYGVRANPSTFSFPEMEKKIRERLVTVRTAAGEVNGFRIAGSLIVCNAHVFMATSTDASVARLRPRVESPLNMSVVFVVADQSYLVEHPLDQLYRIPGKDLVVIHVPSIPPFSSKWNFPALLCDHPPTGQSMADESWLVRRDDTLVSSKPTVVFNHCDDLQGPKVWRYVVDSELGDCGSPLVIRRGATFSIAGFHTARVRGADYCIAEPLSREEFEVAAEHFRSYGGLYELQLDPKQLLGYGDLPPFQELPLKSSLRTTLSNSEYPPEVTVFGCLPGLGGASNKSKVVDTIFRSHPLVQKLEETCGSLPYFEAPRFGGAMEGDRWVDPHTVSLENTFNRGGQRSVWDRALVDYLDGAAEKIQLGPLSPLSDYDAFFGVPDTVLGGTNMQSSAGPPWNVKKSNIIRVDHMSNPKVLEWDPGFQAHLDAIEEVIKGGRLYSPLCSHVLKDEVVTVEKNVAHKVRVFNILPFAFNHLLKKYLGPLVALMREHAYFFESVVGFNICDPKTAEEFFDFVSRFPNCLAFDKKAFDARCSTEEHLTVCRFFRELARLAGYSLEEQEIVFLLCLSSIYPVRYIKSDVFMLACSMPTGFWLTIFFNCVRSSLQARYAYFRIQPTAAPFRSQVAQGVLGDDLLGTVSSRCWWYNQVSIAAALLEIGALTTSFRKGREMDVYEHISEVQFLKRQPRLVEGHRVWALEPKTLIKMLCMRIKSSVVPELDAHAMLMSNVLSESWMWGEDFFHTMDFIVRELALKHGLDKNVYFRRLDFQGYLRLYVSGGLTTWEPTMSAEDVLVSTAESVENQIHGLQTFVLKKPVLSL